MVVRPAVRYFVQMRFLWAMLFTLPVMAAPGPSGAPSSGSLAVVARLLEGEKGLTAKAQLELVDASGTVALRSKMGFAYREGMMRLTMDLSDVTSAVLKPDSLKAMQQLGLARTDFSLLPQSGTLRMAYPALRWYYELPMPKTDAAIFKAKPNVSAAADGVEKVLGLNCARKRVTLKPKAGPPVEVRVWQAASMKWLPVQFEVPEGKHTLRLRLMNVKRVSPEAKLFEPPLGYQKAKSMKGILEQARKRVPPPKKK